MFLKSCLLQRRQKASIWEEGLINPLLFFHEIWHSFIPDKKQKFKGKNTKIDGLERNLEEPASLPIYTGHEKEYEPKLFEDTHISDVIKQNEEMKTKVNI